MNLPKQPIRELTCQGSPFEMGMTQGEVFREEVRGSLETVARLEAVRLMKPAYLPHRLFVRIAEHKAERFLKNASVDRFCSMALRASNSQVQDMEMTRVATNHPHGHDGTLP